MSLDAGYDYKPAHDGFVRRGITPRTANRGTRTPIRTDGRWVVERTNSWMKNFGKLWRCTGRRGPSSTSK
ncbi:hypothetical protein [Streptomyces sp. NPDC001851]|uniref:hypothetical protein n=1 Tax=Streptomyces sp. NPDC001851 TaxID=3154529 RepID=UPI0033252D40